LKPYGLFDKFRELDSDQRSSASNRILLWISFLLAAVFLYFALRGLDWPAFGSAIVSAKYSYLPLIFIWGTLSQFIRAFRWRVLLTAERDIGLRNVFWANMAGYLGNNILPARAGELIRAAYIGKENDIPVSFALATGFVERFIDLIALILLGSVSLASAGIVSTQLRAALNALSAIGMVGLVGILIAPYIGHRLVEFTSSLPLLKPALRKKLDVFLQQFVRGISALHHPARGVIFVLITCLIWLNDGLGTMILGRALHVDLTLFECFLLLAGLGLSSAIPSTPGYVGVYQFIAILILEPFGISRTSALAFILVFQIVNFLIVAFWGGIALWRMPKFTRP
jgi:glycosyltransferase 2 family protein